MTIKKLPQSKSTDRPKSATLQEIEIGFTAI